MSEQVNVKPLRRVNICRKNGTDTEFLKRRSFKDMRIGDIVQVVSGPDDSCNGKLFLVDSIQGTVDGVFSVTVRDDVPVYPEGAFD